MEGRAKRLRDLRAERGLTQAAVAKEIGCSKSLIVRLEKNESDSLSSTKLLSLAALFNVSPEWLERGEGFAGRSANTSATDLPRFKVPIISSTAAGNWAEVSDPLQTGDAEAWIHTTRAFSPNAFALRIDGDSMEPKIPNGSIVLVDPEQEARNGSIVVVRENGAMEATCKRIKFDGPRRYLVPENNRYPIIDVTGKDITICGVVRQIITDLE